jgi:hypothetical protein
MSVIIGGGFQPICAASVTKVRWTTNSIDGAGLPNMEATADDPLEEPKTVTQPATLLICRNARTSIGRPHAAHPIEVRQIGVLL